MRSTTSSAQSAAVPVPATASSAPSRWRQLTSRHFARHYLEMLVAMVAGMVVLGWLEGFLPIDLMARGDVGAVVMATNMAVGMGAWMKVRGHSWASTAEMSAAMYLPFVVLLVPFWAGAVSAGTLMVAGHVLMLPAMAVAMLRRPGSYAC